MAKSYLIGYASKWCNAPPLAEQIKILKDYGCWNVWSDSPDTDNALMKAMADIRPGDTLVVVGLLSLGGFRSLTTVLKSLQRDGSQFCALEEGLDSRRSNVAPLIPTMLQALEHRRSIRRFEIRYGLAYARTQGRKGGRRVVMSAEKLSMANELITSGQHSMAQIAKTLGVSRSSLYNSGLVVRPSTASGEKTKAAH
jgi:DNA invertase Pin-like site-specific DNA recombinase